MVFLQGAARKDSPAGICIGLANTGAIRLFLSDEILTEIRDVLARPVLQRKFPALTAGFVDELLTGLKASSTYIAEVPRAFQYPRDPKDEPYLNLALAARADYLVTRDADLLDLADPKSPEGARLHRLDHQIAIVDPVQFLREIYSKTYFT